MTAGAQRPAPVRRANFFLADVPDGLKLAGSDDRGTVLVPLADAWPSARAG